MPLFIVVRPIIMLNPNRPKNNVPNLDLLGKSLRIFFPKEGLLPVKIVVVALPDPAKLVHGEGDPSPSTPCLNVIPKLMFNQLVVVLGRCKTHCLDIEGGAIRPFRSLIAIAWCQMDHIKAISFSEMVGSRTCGH